MKTFICTYDDQYTTALTLEEAFKGLNDERGGDLQVDDCTFYEAEEIEVEFKITRKEVVSKISKKPSCGA